MRAPDAVLFDADGVLQLSAPGWRELLESFVPGDDPDARTAFLADVFAAETPTLTGVLDFRTELAAVLRRWNSTVAVDDALRPWTMITVDRDALETVRSLRKAGVGCYLATNQQNFRTEVMRRTLGYDEWFDEQYYSSELGLAKPDPAFYRAIAADVDVEPSAALFVDDRADNVEGAREAGLRAEVFTLESGVPALRDLLRAHGLPVD